jgi:hypothetical protein
LSGSYSSHRLCRWSLTDNEAAISADDAQQIVACLLNTAANRGENWSEEEGRPLDYLDVLDTLELLSRRHVFIRLILSDVLSEYILNPVLPHNVVKVLMFGLMYVGGVSDRNVDHLVSTATNDSFAERAKIGWDVRETAIAVLRFASPAEFDKMIEALSGIPKPSILGYYFQAEEHKFRLRAQDVLRDIRKGIVVDLG